MQYGSVKSGSHTKTADIGEAIRDALGMRWEGASPSVLRKLLVPKDVTSVTGMPWAGLAAPALLMGSPMLGWSVMGGITGALKKREREAKMEDARRRYDDAMRDAVQTKSASTALDDLADLRVKSAAVWHYPLAALAALYSIGTTGAGIYAYNKEKATGVSKTLNDMLEEKRRQDFSRIKPLTLKPVPVAVGREPDGRDNADDGGDDAGGLV